MERIRSMTADKPNESERRYQQLIRTSPAPINLFDASGTIIWGNDAVVDLLGLDSRADLVGRSIFEFIDTADRETATRELGEVVDSKNATGPSSMTLRRADGKTRYIRVSTAPGRYQGRDIGQAVIIDVTPQQKVRRELELERQFTENALNTIQDIFYVVNPAGELERWNDTLLELLGRDATEVRGTPVTSLFTDADSPRVAASIDTVLAEGEDVLKASVVTTSGAEVPFEFRKRRLIVDGTVIGLVGIGRDESAQRERDRHLRAVDRLLKHNLRNRLNVIQGSAELLRSSIEDDEVEHIEHIDAAADRLLSIFDNHHNITELLTERAVREPVDLVSILEPVARTVDNSCPKATVVTEFPDSATVSAIPALKKALHELIENAVQWNDRPDPMVEIAVETTGTFVTVEIIDNGPTIPESEYENLAGDDLSNPISHPSGFGLWYVELVLERSGGTLEFVENDADGNTAIVELRTPTQQSNQ